eukprot:COSAG05_NODE_4610_length_1440_cov_0.975391_4_plen_68_part_01
MIVYYTGKLDGYLNGHVAPADELEAVLFQCAFKHRPALVRQIGLPRQEDLPDGIVAVRRQVGAQVLLH